MFPTYRCPKFKRCGVKLIYAQDSLHTNVPKFSGHPRGDNNDDGDDDDDDAQKNQADDLQPRPKRQSIQP